MTHSFPATAVGCISKNVMGFEKNQAVALDANGWQTLNNLSGYTTTDIESWDAATNRQTTTRGGVNIASVRVRRLCALNYWVNCCILHGVTPLEAEFTLAELTSALADYPIHNMDRKKKDNVTKSESFTYERWVDWQDSIVTYLKGKKNVSKTIPLYYVIRPLTAPVVVSPATMSEEDEIIFNANHTGAAYKVDNKTVHQILTEITNGTDADHWIKEHKHTQDGRAA
mmetsp:Transcript_15661/g.22292  ORF Transcript_15661/g.22292 Transcript_15661/m.22292 type:complete len:227 (-) Transcript_15661:1997-2677(-)|eukprot:CAMPEP_0184861902 /NCGR_PEP_ID=MMETSP0580-20130426/6482_1 /TAXON_ID=1118495 /ORGANISM="Dactyliosolen fragilissimus" /LENGTH=226 /DNA_ID=CAMNT_0027359565 /DNA_START=601 /DNA_END=1281 /DNA_ORIENTATION=-